MANTAIQQEIESLRDPDGLLVVENIHEWARQHPRSALHEHLEWDNEQAGYQWRLQQIRHLIIVHCRNPDDERTMVSLRVDRGRPGGGYRAIDDVLEKPSLVKLMLSDARRDAQHFVRKYGHLRDLTGVDATAVTALDALHAFVAAEDRPSP